MTPPLIGPVPAPALHVMTLNVRRPMPTWRPADRGDMVVHFLCTGVIAAVGYLVLAGLRIAPTQGSQAFTGRAAVVLTTTIGLAVSAIWEMLEWAGRTFITDDIFVTYQDTIGDMAMGGVGALAAGIMVARVRLERARE